MDAIAPLSERITAALTGDATSAAITLIITDASVDLSATKTQLDAAERVSLDPLATDDAVSAAADEVIRLGLAIRRRQQALQQLDVRLKAVTKAEEQSRVQVARIAAMKLRDEAVTAMREHYPRLAGELVALMRQATEADEAVRAAGAGLDVEHTLRPMQPGEPPGHYAPLMRALHLPSFESRAGIPLWNGRALG